MANLKIDLLNKSNNAKYFEELELMRLAQEPNMNYKQKLDEIDTVLGNIAMLNAKIGGIEQYFREEPSTKQPVAPVAPASTQQNGQTHKE